MSDILKVASELLTTSISDNPEDYIKTVPKYLLMKFEKHYENQQDWAIRLRSAYDKNSAELKAKAEVIKKMREALEFYGDVKNWHKAILSVTFQDRISADDWKVRRNDG